MKITKNQFRAIQSKYPQVQTLEDVLKISDDQLLRIPTIGKKFVFRLRDEFPTNLAVHLHEISIWNAAIDKAIVQLMGMKK